jgi:Leucine-rich repeat (LRR) protein
MGNTSSAKIYGSFDANPTSSSKRKRIKCKNVSTRITTDAFKDVKSSRRSLKDLKRLEIYSSKLSVIEANAFKSLKNIEEITVKSRRLDTIESQAFDNLTMLKRVNLLGNNLKQIQTNAFHELPKLHEINLRHNKLSVLEPSVFVNLKRQAFLCLFDFFNYRSFFYKSQTLKI